MELFKWNRTIFISRLPESNWTGRATGLKDRLVKQMDRSKKKIGSAHLLAVFYFTNRSIKKETGQFNKMRVNYAVSSLV